MSQNLRCESYRKTESQSASQWVVWPGRWKGTPQTGVRCGEDTGAFCSSLSLGRKQALHIMQGDDTCPWVHTHSSRPAASSQQPRSGWVQNGRVLTLKKKMLFIRFYETNEAGPCGVGGGQCIPPDWWNLLTLQYNWAGFLLLGPSHPSDTPQRFHGLQVTNVWSEQWIARRSLSLRVWCLREDILVPGKGLTYQGLSLRLGRMWPCEEIGRWKVNSVYDISSEDWDPPQGTNIHISTWMGKTTANPSINCLTCTYHVISIAPC